jgi:hypothetical protein
MSSTPKNIGIVDTTSFNQLTVTDSASVDAPTLKNLTESVFLDVVDTDVLVSFNGTDPSATNGHTLYAGKDYFFYAGMIKTAKFKTASGTSKVNITQLNGYA